jgi:MerR family mercuric resistance operon transcriptional regulator
VSKELTIGKLADAVGVNVETIRYYQRLGLLDVPAKPLGGHRRNGVEQAKCLCFIKRA